MLEREDMDQLHRSCDKHGWAGTVFVRDDAEAVYRELLGDENAVMSDELWERVRETRAWRKAIVEAMTDAAWPVVQMAVEEAMGGEQVTIGE